MTSRLAALMVASLVAAPAAADPASVPVLRYQPPANFYHSAITPPDGYESPEVKAAVQVYPFRRFSGDLGRQFQQTLLRDWIAPMFREDNVAAQPQFGTDKMAGAQTVYTAIFTDAIGHPHMRIVVVAAGLAAIVDVSAASNQSWSRAAPAILPMLQSMRVEAGASAPSPSAAEGPGPAGSVVAGLYMGYKAKYMANLNLGPAYGTYTSTLHFYVLSAGGRVYRCYDTINVPGNDPNRFDFDAAQQRDPGNSGRYSVRDGKLTMQVGNDAIVVDAPSSGRLKVYDVVYQKK